MRATIGYMDDVRPQQGYCKTYSNRHVRLWWIAASALGSGTLGLAAVLYQINPDLFSQSVGPLSIIAIPFTVPGILVGAGQWLVLRWWLRLPHPFVVVWVLGSAMICVVEISITFIRESDPWDPVAIYGGQGEIAGNVGLIAGLVQYMSLRGQVRRAWLWILISALGWGIGWPLASFIGDSLWGARYGEALGFLGIGIVTSMALPWLAR